jgi:hypothetical protein
MNCKNENENENNNDKEILLEDNYYYYEALEYLEQDMDEYLQNNYVQKITVSAFQINNEKKYPFLNENAQIEYDLAFQKLAETHEYEEIRKMAKEINMAEKP